mgnify:CR=1 FL=1
MAEKMDRAVLENVLILAKLELSEEEKDQAEMEMKRMLDYVEKLNELDTSGVEPMVHPYEIETALREDEVTNPDRREALLAGAPEEKDGQYVVPKTVE